MYQYSWFAQLFQRATKSGGGVLVVETPMARIRKVPSIECFSWFKVERRAPAFLSSRPPPSFAQLALTRSLSSPPTFNLSFTDQHEVHHRLCCRGLRCSCYYGPDDGELAVSRRRRASLSLLTSSPPFLIAPTSSTVVSRSRVSSIFVVC